uniref:Uncharacterized protein n=1 Tax=Siphoviridae sp. ctBLh2 TaxID=2827803 RepID=A0A8S5S4D0_9CAUD|nr:MAG TPA: hypothetical protein [Siphoviridae sp. ctBLh2]
MGRNFSEEGNPESGSMQGAARAESEPPPAAPLPWDAARRLWNGFVGRDSDGHSAGTTGILPSCRRFAWLPDSGLQILRTC